MPSQSNNKPFPVRLDPELRERVKKAGGSRLVRSLIQIFFGEKLEKRGANSLLLEQVETDLARLEAGPLKNVDLSELDFLSDQLFSVLKWNENKLKHHQAMCLFGRVEWLKARKTGRTRKRWSR